MKARIFRAVAGLSGEGVASRVPLLNDVSAGCGITNNSSLPTHLEKLGQLCKFNPGAGLVGTQLLALVLQVASLGTVIHCMGVSAEHPRLLAVRAQLHGRLAQCGGQFTQQLPLFIGVHA